MSVQGILAKCHGEGVKERARVVAVEISFATITALFLNRYAGFSLGKSAAISGALWLSADCTTRFAKISHKYDELLFNYRHEVGNAGQRTMGWVQRETARLELEVRQETERGQQELAGHQRVVAGLQRDLADLRGELTEQQRGFAEVQDQLQIELKAVKSEKERLADIERSMADVQEELRNAEAKILGLEGEDAIALMSRERDVYKLEVQALKEERQITLEGHQQALHSLQEGVKKQREIIQEKERAADDLGRQVKSTEERVVLIQRQMGIKDEELIRAGELRKEREELLGKRIAVKDEEIADLKGRLSGQEILQKAVEEKEGLLLKAQEEQVNLTRKVDDQEKALTALRETLEAAQKELEELQEKLRVSEEGQIGHAELVAQFAEAKEKVVEAEADVEKLTAQIKAKKKQLSKQGKLLRQTQTQNKEHVKKLREDFEEISKLRADLKRVSKEAEEAEEAEGEEGELGTGREAEALELHTPISDSSGKNARALTVRRRTIASSEGVKALVDGSSPGSGDLAYTTMTPKRRVTLPKTGPLFDDLKKVDGEGTGGVEKKEGDGKTV